MSFPRNFERTNWLPAKEIRIGQRYGILVRGKDAVSVPVKALHERCARHPEPHVHVHTSVGDACLWGL